MSIYAIGDVQGCFTALQALLQKIRFDPAHDQLWFVGDLVNRGPESLQVLRFVKDLGKQAITVLGNHDLHLLAVAEGVREDKKHDLHEIFEAADRNELLSWLRQQPLLHHDARLGYTLIHAGLPPQWNFTTAMHCANELEAVLRSERYHEFLTHMYGNEPTIWSEHLTGWDRLRFICNCFTRLRYCTATGELGLKHKGAAGTQPGHFHPWFAMRPSDPLEGTILFGHWSTLGIYSGEGVYALDSGCVWGGTLSALRIDVSPPQLYQINCTAQKPIDEN
jgi:bis(5'-nucleosyl)-tetraphosphatase (symmetrical)